MGNNMGYNFYLCRGGQSLSAIANTDECGLSPKTISALEVGSHGITVKSAIRLAKTYQKTLSQLTGWEPKRNYFTLQPPKSIPLEQLDAENFGVQLDRILLARGLTSMQLSARTKIARSTITHYRNGRRYPSLTGVLKIAKALNVSCDDLLLPLTVEEREFYEKIKSESSEKETFDLENERIDG